VTPPSDRTSPPAAGAPVLCPVRGGKRSSKTVDRAVALAAEHGAKLIFLYVVDVDFLGLATVARVKLMADELMETGRFALSILADKARARGVAEVEEVIRAGSVERVIVDVLQETGAGVLVVGRPVRAPGVLSFAPADYERMLERIQIDTDIHVQIEAVD